MHSLLSSLKSTSFLLPLLFLLTTPANAYQVKSRQISSYNANPLTCDTRTLPNINPNLSSGSKWNITSTCMSKFLTTCTSSPGSSDFLSVGSLNPDQLELSTIELCDQGGFSSIPTVTPALCACACKCPTQSQGNPQIQEEEMCAAEGKNP